MIFPQGGKVCRFSLVLFTILIINGLSLANIEREKGLPFIQNFSHQEYDGWAQNWSFTQDNEGVLFFANSIGIITFDGARFQRILHPELHMPRSMDRDEYGNVFAGFFGGLGFLYPDSSNAYALASLQSVIPETVSEFYDVWYTQATPDGVFFMTDHYLFRWAYNPDNLLDGEMFVWSFGEDEPLQCYRYINGHHYLHQVGKGLLEIIDNQIFPVSETSLAKKIGVNDIFVIEGNICISGIDGLYCLSEKSIQKLNTEISDFSEEYDGRYVTALGNNRFALTTDHNGIAIFNGEGSIEQVINRDAGIKDNLVLGRAFMDVDGGLWLPLDYGVSRIEVQSPISYMSEVLNLGGYAFRITRFNDFLYVGTSQGLYVLEKADKYNRPYFVKVKNANSHCWYLKVVGDRLLVCTSECLLEVKSDRTFAKIIDNLNGQSITYVNNRVFVGTWYDGVHVFDIENDELVKKGKIENFSGPAQDLVIQDSRYLWFSDDERLVRLDLFQRNSESVNFVSVYDTSRGLPALAYYEPFVLNGFLYAGANKGLYRFDPERERFELDDTINKKLNITNTVTNIYRLGDDNEFWFHRNNHDATRVVVNKNNKYEITYPFSESRITGCYDFFLDTEYQLVWAAAYDGKVIRYDLGNPGWVKPVKNAKIANVILNGDSLLFGGVFTDKKNKTTLLSNQNNLRFEYSLPDFVSHQDNQYRFRLIGLESKWSEWSKENYRDFTSLSSGKYRFEVEGKDISGKISNKGVYEFSIQRAWYNSFFAILLYILAVAAIFYIIVRIRVRKIEKDRETLRLLVEEKTNEALDQFERAKQAEILSKQLKIANQLSATIAHEFNNPMAVIKGNVELIQLESNENGKMQERLTRVNNQIARMTELVEKLVELRELKEIDYAAGVKILDIHPPETSSLEKSKRITDMKRG